MTIKFFGHLSLGIMAGLLLSITVQAQNRALESIDRKDDWWVKRHAENVEKMNQGDIEFLLIGDSITHAWDNHRELYDKHFGEFKPINLGFSGDQTAHVLWRLDHLPLDKITPKVAMLMIGTNNIGHAVGSNPAETAEGIVAIVKKLQRQYPRLQIIVLAVFPRDEQPDGNLRQRVNEINAALPELLREEKNVELLDINAGFLDADGTLPKRIMDDFLHPGREGYEYWGNRIEPVIREKFRLYESNAEPAA
ncbi:MAG: GDSL-type esterase/lipase family protein [Planctomycetaceae bacterium]|nr:GDSL-type esterase/lipase family protein [Planctomycetaceae bacterium]